jgi:hypothetical protein
VEAEIDDQQTHLPILLMLLPCNCSIVISECVRYKALLLHNEGILRPQWWLLQMAAAPH